MLFNLLEEFLSICHVKEASLLCFTWARWWIFSRAVFSRMMLSIFIWAAWCILLELFRQQFIWLKVIIGLVNDLSVIQCDLRLEFCVLRVTPLNRLRKSDIVYFPPWHDGFTSRIFIRFQIYLVDGRFQLLFWLGKNVKRCNSLLVDHLHLFWLRQGQVLLGGTLLFKSRGHLKNYYNVQTKSPFIKINTETIFTVNYHKQIKYRTDFNN